MTINEWRFKILVEARNRFYEFKDSPVRAGGLCHYMRYTIETNYKNKILPDNENLRDTITYFCTCPGAYGAWDVIPEFTNPVGKENDVYWWPIEDRDSRLEFMDRLISIYASKIDKENGI